jgi:hypothetical protein
MWGRPLACGGLSGRLGNSRSTWRAESPPQAEGLSHFGVAAPEVLTVHHK